MTALTDDAVESSPLVQRFASLIVAKAPRRDTRAQLSGLWRFLRERVTFKRDTIGREHLRHPAQLLTEIINHGRTAADCDDLAMLAAALLQAMGIRAGFALVARRPGPFTHVFAVAMVNGRAVSIDPQEGLPLGRWPKADRIRVVELNP